MSLKNIRFLQFLFFELVELIPQVKMTVFCREIPSQMSNIQKIRKKEIRIFSNEKEKRHVQSTIMSDIGEQQIRK
jgi:hypothetical protein